MKDFIGAMGTRGFWNRALSDNEVSALDLDLRSNVSGFISGNDWNALEHIPSEGNWSLTLKQGWRTLWRRKWTFTRLDAPPPMGAKVFIRVTQDVAAEGERG